MKDDWNMLALGLLASWLGIIACWNGWVSLWLGFWILGFGCFIALIEDELHGEHGDGSNPPNRD